MITNDFLLSLESHKSVTVFSRSRREPSTEPFYIDRLIDDVALGNEFYWNVNEIEPLLRSSVRKTENS